MKIRVEMVTVDCGDPESLAQWWADAVGGDIVVLAPGEFVLVARHKGPALGFQRVDDPTPGKNRVHLDFSADDVDLEVGRLVDLGAAVVARHSVEGRYRWVVLTDPEGNVFCLGPTRD